VQKKVYLFIVDVDPLASGFRKKAKRTIQIFRSLKKAVSAKNEYLESLRNEHKYYEYVVIETLAREFVARFRVQSRKREDLPLLPVREYTIQYILRIEPGILMDDKPKGDEEPEIEGGEVEEEEENEEETEIEEEEEPEPEFEE